jgi:hypothetical protein
MLDALVAAMRPGGMPDLDPMADIPLPPERVPMQRIDFVAWDAEDEERVRTEDVALARKTVGGGGAETHARVHYVCDREWCFWCMCSQRVIDISTENEHMVKFRTFLEENWHLADKRLLFRQAQVIFNKELRFWLLDPDMQRPWMMSTMYRHFTEHESAGRFQLEESLADLNEMIRIQGRHRSKLRDRETGEHLIDHKEANMFMKMLGSRRALLKDVEALRPEANL